MMRLLLEALLARDTYRFTMTPPASAVTCQPWYIPDPDLRVTYAGLLFAPARPRPLGPRAPIGMSRRFTDHTDAADRTAMVFYDANGDAVGVVQMGVEVYKRDWWVVAP